MYKVFELPQRVVACCGVAYRAEINTAAGLQMQLEGPRVGWARPLEPLYGSFQGLPRGTAQSTVVI